MASGSRDLRAGTSSRLDKPGFSNVPSQTPSQETAFGNQAHWRDDANRIPSSGHGRSDLALCTLRLSGHRLSLSTNPFRRPRSTDSHLKRVEKGTILASLPATGYRFIDLAWVGRPTGSSRRGLGQVRGPSRKAHRV